MNFLSNFGLVDFNSVWFSFLVTWLSALVSLLLGGDPGSVGL